MSGIRDDGPRSGVDRRTFLVLGGAGLAGAALLSAAGSGVLAQPGGSALEAEFREAAREFGVPLEVLKAMGFVNTRWEMPPPETNVYEKGDLHGWGSYGIMALVQNPSSDTLSEASRLTGIPEDRLKTDRRSNILGGAALLAESQGQRRPPTVGDYFGAVDGRGGNGREYKAVSGIGGGELYAEQVFGRLRIGARGRTKRGEEVALPPLDLGRRITERGELIR